VSEFGRGPRDERDENRDDVPATEAVVMADLRRSRQAVQGPADPGAVRFAENLARAIDRAPGHPDEDIDADDRDVAIAAVAPAPAAAEPLTDPRRDRSFGPASLPPDTVHAGRPGPRSFATDAPARPVVAPGVRETAFGRSGADMLPLPATAAVVVDRSDRIVRVNPAFARLAGRMPGDPENGPLGMPLRRLVVGTDGDARLIRADGTLARVRVVRWDLAMDLQAVVFVELGSASDARRIAELERMARVGTWTYELASPAG